MTKRQRMRSRLRLSPATVISVVALFVALAGTGYAAVSLPAHSVGTAQLKANAVTSAKVLNGSLLGADFKAGQLPAGPQAPQARPGRRALPDRPDPAARQAPRARAMRSSTT
jgi:hypothetical protein